MIGWLLIALASGLNDIPNADILRCRALLNKYEAIELRIHDIWIERNDLKKNANDSNTKSVRTADQILRDRIHAAVEMKAATKAEIAQIPFVAARIQALERTNTAFVVSSFEKKPSEKELCTP